MTVSTRSTLLVAIAIAVAACLGTAVASEIGSGAQTLTDGYAIQWFASEDSLTLTFNFSLSNWNGGASKGWLGFGIGELTSGSMPGSDIVTVSWSSDGDVMVDDRFALGFAYPEVDECQDWVFVSSEEVDGNVEVVVNRLLDTKDQQDRPITPGLNNVVWAWGESSTVSYHQANRAMAGVAFYDPEIHTTPSNEFTVDLRSPGYNVTTDKTQYVCAGVALPTDGAYHVTQIDPLVDPANVDIVHHLLVHVCTNTSGSAVDKYKEPRLCNSPLGEVESDCTSLMYAWAVGGGSLYLPEEAGFPIGEGEWASKHIVLEFHYDNPRGYTGRVDTSGIRIHYTADKRPNDAGFMIIGDPVVTLPPIPGGDPAAHYETNCPSECTAEWNTDINVFASMLHAHNLGTRMWATHWRGDELLKDHNSVFFWSFDAQRILPVNETIKAGDRINLHSVYDTSGLNTSTVFGESSDEEMSMLFISYWPLLIDEKANAPWAFCGYFRQFGAPADQNMTMCGGMNVSTVLKPWSNPTIRDPPGGGETTFGVSNDVCNDDNVVTEPGMNTGLLVGLCVAGALLVAAVVGGVVLFRRRSSGGKTGGSYGKLDASPMGEKKPQNATGRRSYGAA